MRCETAAIAAIGDLGKDAPEIFDAGGFALMPGIIDLHTHYDAQVTWDPTLSPSPSLGVTTAIMGNCGFGIVPAPVPLRDIIMRNLAVVEGMDLDALRAGITWQFQSFAEYTTMRQGSKRGSPAASNQYGRAEIRGRYQTDLPRLLQTGY